MLRVLDKIRGVEVIRKDKQSKLSEKLFRLNIKFFSHITKLLIIIFPKIICLSTFLFIFLLIVVISLELLIYQVGLLSGKFYASLSSKDLLKFRDLAILSVFMIIGNAFLKSLSDFVASLLQITWRKYLTLFLNEKYFANKNFYYLQMQMKRVYSTITTPRPLVQTLPTIQNHQPPIFSTNSNNIINQESLSTTALIDNHNISGVSSVVLDNPDQRITQDVDSMVLSLSKITPILLISPFVIGYYVYKVL